MIIPLEEQHKDEMLNNHNTIKQLSDRYEEFILETKILLRVSQLGFFQNLASIALAFQGLLFVIFTTQSNFKLINAYFLISLAASILLILFCASYGREKIDETDKYLNKTEQDIKLYRNEFNDAVELTLVNRDYSFYQQYKDKISLQQVNKQEGLNFAGEILTFLFSTALFFGIASLTGHYKSILFFILPLISGLVTFTPWASVLTARISRVLTFLGLS